jgi:peptidyl-prolyl cis-trans isomerase C
VTRHLTLVVAIAFATCWQAPPAVASSESPAQVTPPADAAVKPVPAQLPEVVARVNGQPISRDDLQRAAGGLEADVPADQRDRILRNVLDELVGNRLLAQESEVRKIVVPDADVDARLAQIRSQFPSEEVFTQALAQRQLTLESLRAGVLQEMQIERMIDAEVAARITVTSDQVDDFYAKNPASFQQGERVRASHILIRVPDGADAKAKEQARATAAEILKQVQGGGDFAALAKEHSQDPGSGPRGGDLGFFQRGAMVGPFEEAAFSLAPGQSSELVETRFGFHIIKVVDKRAAGTEVRRQVERYLQGLKREREARLFIDALKAKAKVEILI